MQLKDLNFVNSAEDLDLVPSGKILVNTMYAYSFVVAQGDPVFAAAIINGDYLSPDGKSIVWACKFLKMDPRPKERIAGWDLFRFEMERVNREAMESGGGERKRVMFLGSSEKVLALIKERAAVEYPALEIITYSPPYKPEFSEEDSRAMVEAINDCDPDLLWIGMTAPKQEKWAYEHWGEMDIHCHCGTIGAVFDFYAGTVKRAPEWMQKAGLEWLHRLCSNPRRLWKRYLVGNSKFIYYILKEKFAK